MSEVAPRQANVPDELPATSVAGPFFQFSNHPTVHSGHEIAQLRSGELVFAAIYKSPGSRDWIFGLARLTVARSLFLFGGGRQSAATKQAFTPVRENL